MPVIPKRYFVGDFETTVYKGQTYTEVWASASVELGTEDVKVFNSIEKQFEYFVSLNENICVYYHNLKFDGEFWVSYLMRELGFKNALITSDKKIEYIADKEMRNNTFKCLISDMGQWYTITVKVAGHYICFRDSLKLLPFPVRKIGKDFQTKHKKLEITYEGERHANGIITPEEEAYIKNDVLVVKEAMEIMFQEGHKKLTIGSCCLQEYRKIIGDKKYNAMFPDIYNIELDESYGSPTAGDYVRKSYRGGWCYVVPQKTNKIIKNGITADVNSLYPSMMSKESCNKYPVGNPTFWKGNYIPDEALKRDRYYFVRVKTRFYIKHNMLPFIQIKNSFMYRINESLETSDVFDPKTKKYYDKYEDIHGEIQDTRLILTLTETDYNLILEHYELVDFEILDGCFFEAKIGIFDGYIEKYKQMKLNSTGAKRELAKLFLNNLYGKMATSRNSSFKYPIIKDDASLGFVEVMESEKKAGYIPVGSAITSYARNFTIRAAQKNYYGADKAGFIYADTDSIHCDLPPDKIKGITVHDKNFCCWKLEASWDYAIFVRQKTYIEHITHANLQPIDKPYLNIKCAGMNDECKNLFLRSLNGEKTNEEDIEKGMSKEKQDFINTKRDITDFKIGLKIPAKLIPKHIAGGVLLVDTTYEMR